MPLPSRTVSAAVELPSHFTPTHHTAGLPGYPAIDLFGSPGAPVVARFYGRVTRISGRACALGGTPGGSYGQSLYVRNMVNGVDRYLTHLDELLVGVGALVWPGRTIATLCDSRVSGKPGTTHVHYGIHRP